MTFSVIPNSSTVALTLGLAALLYIVRWLADKQRYDIKRIPSAVSAPPLLPLPNHPRQIALTLHP